MPQRSKLVSIKLRNLGCIGPEGLEILLDDIICLVGRNNTGKSTVIRAYELAQSSGSLGEHDRCQWTPEDDWPEVEISVHIPDGIPNIDEKWKKDVDGLKIVTSRWQWKDSTKPLRQTWDPVADDWAEDGKAGGADNVFKSRLPQPIRIDSLQDAFVAHDDLLKLVTEPAQQRLKQLQEESSSPLQLAIQKYVDAALEPITQYQEEIDRVGREVHGRFSGIFPDLNLTIRVGMQPPTIDASKALLAGSRIIFQEGSASTSLKQQGTGARRALFWALLQVRNMIVQDQKTKSERAKAEVERAKRESKLRSDLEKEQAKPEGKRSEVKVGTILGQIRAVAAEGEASDDPALPGYILLIDEPENCLHPMAIRAARAQLYALAEDPNWQVLLSTHSPYFIDPLADHTTIVRLERHDSETTPRTFRTASANFDPGEKEKLRGLLQLDSAVAEMFFGSYPIVVEGDTELAAFIASVLETQDPMSTKVTLVPARGKSLVAPLVHLLTHFGIPFGVLHDTDSPLRTDGRNNGMWTENLKIMEAVAAARRAGIEVRHKVSVPDFERFLNLEEGDKEKPIKTYLHLMQDHAAAQTVREKVRDLFEGEVTFIDNGPLAISQNEAKERLRAMVGEWAASHAPNDIRFSSLGQTTH